MGVVGADMEGEDVLGETVLGDSVVGLAVDEFVAPGSVGILVTGEAL
jgi:hypothetical protein